MLSNHLTLTLGGAFAVVRFLDVATPNHTNHFVVRKGRVVDDLALFVLNPEVSVDSHFAFAVCVCWVGFALVSF